MNKELNIQVLDLIYNSIVSEGGDGDAIWLSKHTSLIELQRLVVYYNGLYETEWEIQLSEDKKSFQWGIDQEWATITDDKEMFDNCPSYIILKINY